MNHFPSEHTPNGFRWGCLEVTCIADDPKWGMVIHLMTPRGTCLVRVTPSGLLSVGEVEAVKQSRRPEEASR